MKKGNELTYRKFVLRREALQEIVIPDEGNLTKPRHRIAALWRDGMNLKGRVWAARGARGR